MINNITLVGRMTKNVDLKYTGSGIAVANITLAVERSFTNAQGERETDFINCVVWRSSAENLSKMAVRGSLIGVTGSVQTRNYENNEGRAVYITEILIDKWQALEPKSVTDARRNENGDQQQSNQYKREFSNENPFKDSGETVDIDDDDLPF